MFSTTVKIEGAGTWLCIVDIGQMFVETAEAMEPAVPFCIQYM